MAIIDKIQLSGTVYTIGNETTTAVTSASTDNEIPTAKAVYDAIPQGGGGKAIEAGTNISITTGDTADTINCTLPISGGTGTNALIYNSTINVASGDYSHSEGYISKAEGYASHAEGLSTKSKGFGSHAEGYFTITTNESEHSSGRYNNSVSSSTTFGNSGNTLFSVGNGTADNARHNAFEIRQNGDIYITKDGQDVKLQDQLGGGGGSSYTAGDGIDITNDVISVTGKVDTSTYNTYTASTDTALREKANTATTYTKTETDNAITAATSTKQDTLVSGTNIKTINGETLLGEGNIEIQGGSGGGKAIEAGTNISITTGETADTINCKLPYYIDSGTCWTIFGDSRYASNKSTNASNSAYIGFNNEIKNTSTRYNTYDNIIIGSENKLDSYYDSFGIGDNVIIGEGNTLSGRNNISESYVIGRYNKGYSSRVFVCGYSNESRNHYETSFGHYNNSVSASTTFGDSGNTLFSVGNGTSNNARHNAFEIRQNGDIYITKDGQDVKLQDQLGGGGGSSYTAGDGIDINNDVISVTGKVDTSTFTAHTADTVIHVTSAEKTAWNNKQDVLVSGTNIKTINGETLLGEGNITIEGGGSGGSITIDQTLDSGSTNPVANSAITNAINSKENHLTNYLETWTILKKYSNGCNALYFTYRKNDEDVTGWFPFANINGKSVESENNFSLVETSAITTSITSESTDAQVPSAKAVNDQLGGLKLVKLTQSEYDSLATKDNSTLYVIVN